MLARYKRWLVPLLQQVHALQAAPLDRRLLALEIQESLLYRMSRAEWLLRRIRNGNKTLKKELTRRDSTREASRKIKARYATNNERMEEQKDLLDVLRSIGDCIAFIYGDRWDLKQMVLKEEAGFLTGKSGTRLERKILREAFAAGATVVMNDLTHTLRFGDITLFRPDLWPDGGSPFIWFEVKSGRGGDASRALRQKAASQHIGNYLATDRREADGGLYQRVELLNEPVYHFEVVSRLMSTLPRGGWLLEEIEPGLHYILIDGERKQEGYEEIFGSVLKQSRSFLLNVNEMKQLQRGYYPFPLSISDPEALYRFLNGEFVMFVVVDLDQVNRQLRGRLVTVSASDLEGYPWKVSLDDPDIPVELRESFVGLHPIGRLAAEFISLAWLVENLVSSPIQSAMEDYLARSSDSSRDSSTKVIDKEIVKCPRSPGFHPLPTES